MLSQPAFPGRSREIAAVAGASICFGLIFSYPIIFHLGEQAIPGDWAFVLQMSWAEWKEIVHFHQLPLWNPYKCGGIPLFGNPQSRVLTPFMLFHLMLGPIAGTHIEIPLHLAVAWAGGYVLGRVQGLGPIACAAVATIFPASSWFSLQVGAGHLIQLAYCYVPWLFALFWLAIERRSFSLAAACGLVMALMVGEGGTYATPQAGLMLGVLVVAVVVVRRSLWPIAALGVTAAIGLGLAAVKLWPAYEMMSKYPRPVPYVEYAAPFELMHAIIDRNQWIDRPFSAWGFHEYGAYLSLGAIGLAIVGLLTRPGRLLPWLAIAAVSFAIAMGAQSPHSLYFVLHSMPIFSSMRLPFRFLVYFTFAISVIAGFGTQKLVSAGKAGRIVAILILGFVVIDSCWVGTFNLGHVLVKDPNLEGLYAGESEMPRSPSFRQYQEIFSPFGMLLLNEKNLGAAFCYEYTGIPTRVLGYNQPGYRGEQYLAGPGSVELVRWTPNELLYQVDVPARSRLTINQNYDPGWRVSSGNGVAADDDGLLAVDLPPGRQRIEVAYRGDHVAIGLAISVATMMIAVLVWFWERKKKPVGATKPVQAREP